MTPRVSSFLFKGCDYLTDEIETLRKRMVDLKIELEKITKSILLNNEEKKQREELINSLNEDYQKIKKQIARIKFEERKDKDAKNKR